MGGLENGKGLRGFQILSRTSTISTQKRIDNPNPCPRFVYRFAINTRKIK